MTDIAPLPILHFTDALCVWAYIGDVRIDEVKANFAGQVAFSHHFISIHGDMRRRVARAFKTQDQYADHVQSVAARFDHVEVHPELFRGELPPSSTPVHLFLRAVKLLEDGGLIEPQGGESVFFEIAKATRTAFFRDRREVFLRREQEALAERFALPVGKLFALIDEGRAHAELAHDAELQKQHGVAMSPALVLNEGRQLLNGNVGYRVIEANVRELLRGGLAESSWC